MNPNQEHLKPFIRGYYWKARMFNGAVFSFWTPSKMDRKEAIPAMLDYANGDYEERIYNKPDILSIWENKNIRNQMEET